MNRKKVHLIFIFLSLFIFVLISINKYNLIKKIDYNRDEIDYIGNSFLFSHYSINQIDKDIWTKSWAYDQPHLYHYLAGFYIQNKYQQPIKDILQQYSFNLRSPPPRDYGVTWNNLLDSQNFINSHQLIDGLRQINFWIYVISFFIICLTSFIISGKIGVFFSLLLYYFANVFTQTLIPATSDALLFFFINLSLLIWSIQFKYRIINHVFILFLIQSVISGLAFSTKINGGMLIMISCYLSLFYWSNFDKIKYFFISIIIPILIFSLTNPFILIKPFTNFIYMIWWRFYINSGFAINELEGSISSSLVIRFLTNGSNVFSSRGYSLLSIMIVFFIFYYNIKYILNTNFKKLDEKFFIPVFFIIELICFLYISINWPRYYTPVRLAFYFNIITMITIYLKQKKCLK